MSLKKLSCKAESGKEISMHIDFFPIVLPIVIRMQAATTTDRKISSSL